MIFSDGLSPDGSTFAVAIRGAAETHIRSLSLSGGPDREITVKDWPNLLGLDWSADSKGLYCGTTASGRGTLLYVDLTGSAHILWQPREATGSGFIGGIPSPDGRFLAICAGSYRNNVWMVEGF
jgi:Tol biopolymer transport system component